MASAWPSSQLHDLWLKAELRSDTTSLRSNIVWDSEDDAREEEWPRPKQAKTLRRMRLIAPPSMDGLYLDPQEILLGAPPLLNPPLISVYVHEGELPLLGPPPTGKPVDREAAAREPPDGEADGGLLFGALASARGASVGISWRQTRLELQSASQGRIQSAWLMRLQGISCASAPCSMDGRQNFSCFAIFQSKVNLITK